MSEALRGAVARYLIDGAVGRRTGGSFPWGTFVVNLTGCFMLGFLLALLTERFPEHATLRAALTTGFLGAYTTFSTFALDSVRLTEDGVAGLAVANVVGSVVLGMAAAWMGTLAGKAV